MGLRFFGTGAALLVASAISAVTVAQAQVARIEYLPFESTTLTDAEFLTGRKDGPRVTLAGELRLPKVGDEKLPAVVLVHGSGAVGGAAAPVSEWARALNDIGIATFAIDSFSGRGIVQTSTDQKQLGRLAMIVDAYRALEVLAKHRQIDPGRIALMGFSRGGQVTLYASLKRFQQMHGPAGVQYAAFLPFYPACVLSYRQDEDVDRPIRIFHGAADDYNPVAACRPYIDRLTKAGRDVKLYEYPGAHHVFDGRAVMKPTPSPASQSVRACRQAEDESGQVINLDTGKPFSYTDACVQRGVMTGYDEAAFTQSHADVKEFLTTLFRLQKS
jgi:dienelactone hydrolase